MGIPKFFRYISERYPLISQVVDGDKIPEFDNLYLDFNGIIHNCSHPNDADAHFRITEEQIFTAIFAYVDHLFNKIQPKKLFFMAVDGVAPRAKMNQQRSRRFRTAKEAREVREKAERAGEKLPDEKAFDSNCITPGTPFMARLSDQLHYFVHKKVNEDANWRNVQIVLSGHSVPGEGEHKIMEYIRLSRAQEDYDPNVRHCLYGLDADLIMLGLLSHDPHFCLLREEVKFGPAAKKKGSQSLESQMFFLLHLSLMREYLDLEFQSVSSVLSFEYDLERVIDDFVLLAVFVGNDFLPHLPDFHIHDNALERLFEIYKNVLPKLGGYLNSSGVIDLARLQIIMDELSILEQETFVKDHADMNWYKGKQSKHTEAAHSKNKTSMTQQQAIIFQQVHRFALDDSRQQDGTSTSSLALPNTFSAGDRDFIKKLADDLNMNLTWDEYNADDENLVTFRRSTRDDDQEGDSDPEAQVAVQRALKKYLVMDVMSPDETDFNSREDRRFKNAMDEWKRRYYKEKLDISYDNPEEIDALVFRYVEGLQWVMYYYYSGVASWGWFYDYHFAPRITDIKNISQLQFHFTLGVPFKPYEQLMGVLPAASRSHIPSAFRDLMVDPNSPILDFYPGDFEQDLNGKKQEWEAVVKIPFIDQDRLLRAMQSREHRLSVEERQRNEIGTSTIFTYNPEQDVTYPSSLPGFFPDIHHCKCFAEAFDLPTLDGLHLVPGLLDGVSLGAAALAGFPSLKTLENRAELLPHGVNVFQTASRNKSLVLYITNVANERRKTADVAREMVGKRTFINWPFLREGVVSAVSDALFRYEIISSDHAPVATPHSPTGVHQWKKKAEHIEETYSKRFGVIVNEVEMILHVRPLKGLKRIDTGALIKEYEDRDKEIDQAIQTAVGEVISEDPRFVEKEAPLLEDEFPPGSKVFFLGEHAYGVAAQVSETTSSALSVVLAFFPSEVTEHEKFTAIVAERKASRYFPSFKVSQMLAISGLSIAKITSSLMVITSDGQKINLGLSLKFEAKGLKVLDYSRKDGKNWEYSERAIQLMQDYKNAFPQIFRVLDNRSDAIALASDVFPGNDPDKSVREAKKWLKDHGVGDFEAVSLLCDQLQKDTISEIEKLAEGLSANKTPSAIKKAVVKGIPRQAVLKPSHATYKLQNQHFALGDRVIMVQETGSVPLSAKGVVVGLSSNAMEVVWDVAFMSGTTLSNRCSQYRGLAVSFDSCLNLTDPQYVMSTQPTSRPVRGPFKPQYGPRPAVGMQPTNGLTVQANGNSTFSPKILTNPSMARTRNTGVPYDQVIKGSSKDSAHNTTVEDLRDSLNYNYRGGRGRGARGRVDSDPQIELSRSQRGGGVAPHGERGVIPTPHLRGSRGRGVVDQTGFATRGRRFRGRGRAKGVYETPRE